MPNRLINETSPYLLQHANNPVNWYSYGIEAFEEAHRRNCPIIISIGYSACHWCHVMEHESFSVPEVAEIMNRLFVCIKVDREERPDVDQVYLNAVQLLHVQGGWRLNSFALPDGRPFWGGTYFRPDQWTEILQQLSDLYHNNFDEILSQAERIHKGIQGMGIIDPPQSPVEFNLSIIEDIYTQLSQKFDASDGGTKGAPKFPMPTLWQFVLNYHYLSQSTDALSQLDLTLEKMAKGGIFDQLAGGFARYSTDAIWKVPHFEKMLYDNAQLSTLYATTFLVTGKTYYLHILTKILNFIETDLTSPEGAFYSALDADSEGEEGLFYLWEKQEIMNLLPEYGELLSHYWGIDKQGHWEKEYNILVQPYSDEKFAAREHLSAEELRQLVKMSARVLLDYRNKRVHPNLDDKIILSWNALMIKGYATAAMVSDNQEWNSTAIKAADFISGNMIKPDGQVFRTWKNGKSKINGFLDDYAFIAEAFITLYNLTFEEEWLFKAKIITEYAIKEFSQTTSPLFWYMPANSDDTNIIKLSRILETTDGVEPSGNSVMSWVLLCLGNYFENQEYIDRSALMCSYIQKSIIAYPSYHANWASITAAHTKGVNMVVIAGEKSFSYAKEIQRQYHPFTLLAAANNKSELPVFKDKFRENRTVIYKCMNHSCDAPVELVQEVSF